MPRISKVWWQNIRYGWLFDIQTIGELYDYLDAVIAPRSRSEFSEALKYAQGIGHANTVAYMAGLKGISIVDAVIKLNTDRSRGMEQALFDTKRIFVNGVGGYFGNSEDVEVYDTREIDVWALPDEQPRFIQWPGGKHWYAKIGDEDIVVANVQKWDTRKEAEQASRDYLAGKRR